MCRIRPPFRLEAERHKARCEFRVHTGQAVPARPNPQPDYPRRAGRREHPEAAHIDVERGLAERAIEDPQQIFRTMILDLADEPQRDVQVGGRNPPRVHALAQLALQGFSDLCGSLPDLVVQFNAHEKPHGDTFNP